MIILCVQDAVIKFLIETEAVGWKASDWNLERPDWTGKMRLVRGRKKWENNKFILRFVWGKKQK